MRINIRHFHIFRTEPHRYEERAELAGVIYVHRISDTQSTGIAGRNFNVFRKLCGSDAMRNVALVTSMWNSVSPEVGKDCENQLSSKLFKPALDKQAQMIQHNNTPESAHNIIRKIMEKGLVVLHIQRELVIERKRVVDTAAGKIINQEFNEQIVQLQADKKRLESEKARLEADKKQLEADKKQLEATKEQLEADKTRLEADKARLEADKARLEADNTQLQGRIGKIEKEKERADADRAKLKQDIEELRDRITIPIYQ